MANSVYLDQTAPIGAVCSRSTLFACILNSSVMLGNYLQQTTSADDILRCFFFLGPLRVICMKFRNCLCTSWHYVSQTAFNSLEREVCKSVIIWNLSDLIPRNSVSVTIVSKENLTSIFFQFCYSASIPSRIGKYACSRFRY